MRDAHVAFEADTTDLVDAARALGAFAVIDKPFDLGDLVPLVERAASAMPAR